MLLRPRASIDHRCLRELGSHSSSTLQWMPDHKDIGIVLDDPDSVSEVLALLHRRTLRLRETQSCTAKLGHGGLEAELGPGARLEEERGHDFPMKHVRPLPVKRLHDLCHVENMVHVGTRQVPNRHQVSARETALGQYSPAEPRAKAVEPITPPRSHCPTSPDSSSSQPQQTC